MDLDTDTGLEFVFLYSKHLTHSTQLNHVSGGLILPPQWYCFPLISVQIPDVYFSNQASFICILITPSMLERLNSKSHESVFELHLDEDKWKHSFVKFF